MLFETCLKSFHNFILMASELNCAFNDLSFSRSPGIYTCLLEDSVIWLFIRKCNSVY